MKPMCILFGLVVLFAVVASAEDKPAVKTAEEPEDDVDISKLLEALEEGVEDGVEEAEEEAGDDKADDDKADDDKVDDDKDNEA